MAFSYSRSLTIDHTKCGASDSSNFPVLVKISDATFKDAGHGGHVQDSAGADIIFYSDSAGTTQIASEIDFYDNVNGVLWAWVKVASVSHTVDTVFYVFYGNASPPSRTTNPWDANYISVYHLGDGTTLGLGDSIGAHNLTNTGSHVTAAAGKIGGAGSFNGSNGDLVTGAFTMGTTVTVEFWAKTSVGGNQMYVMKSNVNASWEIAQETNIELRGGGSAHQVSVTAPSVNDWHHFVGVLTGTSGIIYIDGSPTSGTIDAVGNTSTAVHLGNYDNSNYFLNGQLDEVRISNSVRGADWITAEYNNQNNPGTLITTGNEQSLGATEHMPWARLQILLENEHGIFGRI